MKTGSLAFGLIEINNVEIESKISGSLSPQHGAMLGWGWRNVNKQSRKADNGWPSSLAVGRGANNYFDVIKSILLTINKLQIVFNAKDIIIVFSNAQPKYVHG